MSTAASENRPLAAPTAPAVWPVPSLAAVAADSLLAMRKNVDRCPAGLAKHESTHSPLLVAQRITDLETKLRSRGVHSVDVINLNGDPRCRRIRIANDGYLSRGVGR
jgi:predicted secreted Zn-dependent protease